MNKFNSIKNSPDKIRIGISNAEIGNGKGIGKVGRKTSRILPEGMIHIETTTIKRINISGRRRNVMYHYEGVQQTGQYLAK